MLITKEEEADQEIGGQNIGPQYLKILMKEQVTNL